VTALGASVKRPVASCNSSFTLCLDIKIVPGGDVLRGTSLSSCWSERHPFTHHRTLRRLPAAAPGLGGEQARSCSVLHEVHSGFRGGVVESLMETPSCSLSQRAQIGARFPELDFVIQLTGIPRANPQGDDAIPECLPA
jgi:hypothetical protein